MDVNSLINIAKDSAAFLQPAISGVVSALLTTLFLRKNTGTSEFEKIKAGKFNDAIELLLLNGKMTYFEFYKCHNFLSIAKLADKYSEENKKSSNKNDGPFNFDWFMRFFEAASNISNIDMQILWARILSGEVGHQGSFSLRALETLRNMSQYEAMTFKEMSGIVLDNKYIFSSCGIVGQEVNTDYAFDNSKLFVLDEIGVLSGMLCTSVETLDVGEIAGFDNGDYLLTLTSKVSNFKFEYKYYNLSHIGQELLPIIFDAPNNDYLCDLGKSLKNCFSSVLNVCVHPIDKRNEEELSYNADIDLISNISP